MCLALYFYQIVLLSTRRAWQARVGFVCRTMTYPKITTITPKYIPATNCFAWNKPKAELCPQPPSRSKCCFENGFSEVITKTILTYFYFLICLLHLCPFQEGAGTPTRFPIAFILFVKETGGWRLSLLQKSTRWFCFSVTKICYFL